MACLEQPTSFDFDDFQNNYSMMPRPFLERAAFFGECTLNGMRACIIQPAYCTHEHNAPRQTWRTMHPKWPNVPYMYIKNDNLNTILNNIRQTTKTVQKPTKPSNENNRATNWKKTTSFSYTTASVCTEKNHYSEWETTRNEKRQNENC